VESLRSAWFNSLYACGVLWFKGIIGDYTSGKKCTPAKSGVYSFANAILCDK